MGMDLLGALYDWMSLDDPVESAARQLLVLFLSAVFLPIAAWIAWELAGWLYPAFRGLIFPLEEEICVRTKNGYVYRLGAVWRLYYWIFPKKLMQRRVERRTRAQERENWVLSDLLLEYEKLRSRKKWLEAELNDKASALSDFSWKVRKLTDSDYAEKQKNGGERGETESLDVGKLATYEETNNLAVELKNVKLRLFAIKQELKLHDVDKPKGE